jgi:predicted transport protein
MRQWIAFRSARRGRTFAEIRLSRRGLQIFLLPPRDTLKDPAGLAETPPPSQGWGWFLTKVSVQGNGHVAQVFGLLRQSYLYSRTLPAARRRR